jgi:hypothetical protein
LKQRRKSKRDLKMNRTSLTLQDSWSGLSLVLCIFATLGSTGCTGRSISASEDNRAPRPQTLREESSVAIVSVSTAVVAGDPIVPLRLRRIRRSANDLADRVDAISAVVNRSPMTSSTLQTWSDTAVSDRHAMHTTKPYVEAPSLVVTYRPYLDYLTVDDNTEATANGSVFLREQAEEQARLTLTQLGLVGVVDGEYVLARSGAVGFAAQGSAPFASHYAFNYFRVEEGHLLNESWVEVYVNADLRISRIAVRDVEVVSHASPLSAFRSTQEAATQLEAHINGVLGTISSGLSPEILSSPVPAYHLDPGIEESVAVPEVSLRWAASRPGMVSRARVSALGFVRTSAPREINPAQKPSFCVEYEADNRIARRNNTVVIDSNFAFSFVDSRMPIVRCQEGRLFHDSTSGKHVVRGVVPGEVLARLGLQDGDRDLELCSTDPASSSYGACSPLSDFASFGIAFASLSDSASFSLRFERLGTGMTLAVSLLSCPVVGGSVDCTPLL